MTDLDVLLVEARKQVDEFIESLKLDRDNIRDQAAVIIGNMEEAARRAQAGESGQIELIEQLAKELHATIAIPTLRRNREAQERVRTIISVGIGGFFKMLIRGLGAAVLLLAVGVLPGCSWFTPSTNVPHPVKLGVAGLVENLCEVAAKCESEDRIAAAPADCGDEPGTLYYEVHQRKVDGFLIRVGGANICTAIDQCVAADVDPPLPDNMPPIYSRWCGTVQGIADAAIGT